MLYKSFIEIKERNILLNEDELTKFLLLSREIATNFLESGFNNNNNNSNHHHILTII